MNSFDYDTYLLPILRIASPSEDESAMATYMADALRARGFTVEIDALYNVKAVRKHGPDPYVPLLNAHLDYLDGFITPPNRAKITLAELIHTTRPSDARECNGLEKVRTDPTCPLTYLYSDHGYLGLDDKGGLALILALVDRHPTLDCKVLCTVQEEIGREGIAYVIRHDRAFFADVGYCVTVDREHADDLVNKYAGMALMNPAFERRVATLTHMTPIASKAMADTYNIACLGINAVNCSLGGIGHQGNHSTRCIDYVVVEAVDRIFGALDALLTGIPRGGEEYLGNRAQSL